MSNNLSLTNTRDIKANNIYLNYLNDIKNILEIFALKNDLTDIIGLPPETLDTIQKLAEALGNRPDFFNYVDQQLALKRNVLDSYDKNYINTLILNYYTKTQIDSSLLLKSDKLTTYNKIEANNLLSLKQNNLIFPPTTEGGANGWFAIDNQFTVRKILGISPIISYIELDIDNPASINEIRISLDQNLTTLTNYYTKTQTDTLITNLIGNAPALLNTLN